MITEILVFLFIIMFVLPIGGLLFMNYFDWLGDMIDKHWKN